MKSADLKIKEMEITSKEKISKEKPKTKWDIIKQGNI
jgi:hypothetical protein